MSAQRIVIVGGGFAGYECARYLERHLEPHEATVSLVAARDYMLYNPLLPQVATGELSPSGVAVPLRKTLRRTLHVPGGVVGIDLDERICVVRDITGELRNLPYDRLVLCPGSITRRMNIDGLAEHAYGMKNLAEAVYLRDKVIGELELANACRSDAEREERCRFVVVGAGYAGTETAAALFRLTANALPRYPNIRPEQLRWHLLDVAPRVMPELGTKLGGHAADLLAGWGMDVSMETSIDSVTPNRVRFTDGRDLPCRTVIWTAGVTASPLVDTLDIETEKHRIVTRANLTVPGHEEILALGDAAAVPDLAKGHDAVCPPTAQHASRQGASAGRSVCAGLRGQPLRDYRHRDLGLVVDLGGPHAVANPLGITLSGLPAQVVTRAYHLAALPTFSRRAIVGADWLLHAVAGDPLVRLGFLSSRTGTLIDLENTEQYLNPEQLLAQLGAASTARKSA